MSFEIAYKKTMVHEGLYSNDSVDFGGETVKGISRRFHPDWSGWGIIDYYKQFENFRDLLKNSKKLGDSVKAFYKKNYWDIFDGDEINSLIAIEMFDTAVNMGIKKSILFLQIGLNCLNRNEILFKDLIEDSFWGNNTKNALNLLTKTEIDIIILLKILNVLQGNHYIEIMKKNHTQEKYARGWFNRVEIKK